MSQVSSWSVANGAGSAVRAAMNTLFAALQSCSSGPAAPSPTVAGMLWFDTTNLILKRRNNANTAWIDVSLDTLTANTLRGNPTGSAAAEQEVSMAQLRTMLGFAQSIAQSGYVQLPGGLIVQWGTTVGTTNAGATLAVTFPIAFPTGVQFVLAGDGDNTPSVFPVAVINSSRSATGFSAGTTVASSTVRINYIAIGS